MPRTLSPELLRQRLLADDPPVLLDTRSPSSFEAWHVPGAVNYPFKPDEPFDAEDLSAAVDLQSDDEIVTVCAKGRSSNAIARELESNGFDEVSVVQDGMEGWSRLYEVAAVPTVATGLEIFQVQRVAKGCLGYVIGSPRTGDAAVVDPTRHSDEFIDIVEDDEMSITHVIDTHVHADHISGGRDLAEATNATYYLPAAVADRDIALEYEPLERNEVIDLGDVDLKAIATPGHTSESISLLIGAEAILTGDTLFVDSVGRTELQYGDAKATTGARQLYRSIHGSILALPDDVTVLPGHFSAERPTALEMIGSPIRTTVGERRTAGGLLALDETAFVERLVDRLGEKPPNYERVIAINRGLESPTDTAEATELELGPNRCAIEAD